MKHERRKIALAQMANAGSVEKSLQKSLALLREAAENGADGAVLGVQKMVHVAQAPQFCEQDYPPPLGRVGIVVCFDRHYPESIRTEALRGYRRFGTAQAVTLRSSA
ncbi:hypothetical protein [Agathobaculum sp.]|uniref:hypothetical protein n=1 Tax=Agathobaculum sp. TaxID=2048138 RepID=UPI003AF0C2F9